MSEQNHGGGTKIYSYVHGVGKQNFRKKDYIAHCRFLWQGSWGSNTNSKCYAFGKFCEECKSANHVPAKCPTNSKIDQSTHRDNLSLVLLVLEMRCYEKHYKSKYEHSRHKQRLRAHAKDSVEADDQGTGSDFARDYSSISLWCMYDLSRETNDSDEPSEIEAHNVHAVKRSKVYEKKVLATMELVENPYP